MLQNKTRAQRGLPPYQPPKKGWDISPPRSAPEKLVEVSPSSRSAIRTQHAGRHATARKAQKRATAAALKRRNEEQDALGLARVYFNLDGAHERSPHLAANVKRRVQDIAEAISERDGVPFTTAMATVEGTLRGLVESAGMA